MNSHQKRQLDKLIQENNVSDNTYNIRQDANSSKIHDCVKKIEETKKKLHYTRNFTVLDKECMKHSSFLFVQYPNIYNKLLKYQIDVKILYRFLDELKSIEDGSKNQHEASFEIGKLLKKMYVDKELEDIEPSESPQEPVKINNISYADYKKMN